MGSLDDLPRRPKAHDVGHEAEVALLDLLRLTPLFIDQNKSENDYGTDYCIEARTGEAITNFRMHIQVKGVNSTENSDGSVSLRVSRTNLNYLLAQPLSLYVVYHLPSRRLLYRLASDVYAEYEHRGCAWQEQKSISVRLSKPLDETALNQLHAHLVSSGQDARDRRLQWVATPPSQISTLVRRDVPSIEVPADPSAAFEILEQLYESGHDRPISRSFERFKAVLGTTPGAMDFAYMAEINLGINGVTVDEQRVRDGINAIHATAARAEIEQGSAFYTIGNGWLALGAHEKALACFREALDQMRSPKHDTLAAQCCKNMAEAEEARGNSEDAHSLLKRALQHDPDLAEAHLALSHWHRNQGDPDQALTHLDRILPRRDSAVSTSTVLPWRADLLFQLGRFQSAFRVVRDIIGVPEPADWAWPWSAQLVAQHGRSSAEAAKEAVAYWRAYLREHPGDLAAERHRLLCLCYLRMADAPTGIDFATFKSTAVRLATDNDGLSALLWDRVGHWAQCDDDWVQAEAAYREAARIDPDLYGYCLGTALNSLERYAEALPILMAQAEKHTPDALSWFQVAKAREGVGDVSGSIDAYHRAIRLDENYALAWFNLGGMYWNSRDTRNAAMTWKTAIERFPSHPLSQKLRDEYPTIVPTVEQGE